MEIDSDKITKLFFKVWRNTVIKKNIIHFLRLFKVFYNIIINEFEDATYTSQNQEFFRRMRISIDETNMKNKEFDIELPLRNLPNNIDSIILYQELYKNTNFLNKSLTTTTTTTTTTIINNDKIKSLILHDGFNNRITIENFSIFSNLVNLEFGEKFNEIINDGVLPNTLLRIKFNYLFNQLVNKNNLPNSLESISFGNCFNRDINNLPDSIKVLKLPEVSEFSQIIISKKLPKSLTYLSLPSTFNDSNLIDGMLPNSIKKLKSSNIVNLSSIKNKQSNYLKLKVFEPNGNLMSNTEFLKFLKFSHFESITTYDFSNHVENICDDNDVYRDVPFETKNIYHYQDDESYKIIIPPSVTSLTLYFCLGYHEIEFIPSIIHSIDFSLKRLQKTYSYSTTIVKSPSTLFDKFNEITSLKFDKSNNYFLFDNYLGKSLSNLLHLDISNFNFSNYSKPIKNFNKTFPNLKTLRIGNYNSSFNKDTLPSNLEVLELGEEIVQRVNEKWLPKSIKHLILKGSTPISINNLPTTLITIWVKDDHHQLYQFRNIIPILDKLIIITEFEIKNVFKRLLKKLNYNY
ncbi:hypothetical protein ACTFIW_007484 [Dictyostelium discoideum]